MTVIPLLIILFLFVFLPLLFALVQYNGLVTLRNYISESSAGIDTELKRRYDLIPNLVSTVKAYAAHERAVLERVTELRAQYLNTSRSPAESADAETRLEAAIKQTLAVAESYPQIKADQHFLELQRELVNTEDRIQAARRFYNANVRDYRNRCESFPSNIIAQMFGFQARDFFTVEPAERETPRVG